MTDDLIFQINRVFALNQYNNSWHDWRNHERPKDDIKYMEIPINTETFDVPLFAMPQFLKASGKRLDLCREALVVQIATLNRTSRYKSLERVMQDILNESYASRLVRVPVKQKDEPDRIYYCTAGAVFDEDFDPIMVCSWQMRREWIRDKRMYRFVKPVIWMNPLIYADKFNKMSKFLTEKFTAHIMDRGVSQIATAHDFCISSPFGPLVPKVVFDVCPFRFQQTTPPSISVTNEELLKLAADHVGEIVRI